MTSLTVEPTDTRASRGTNLRINGERLWSSLMEMATIGPRVAGGNNRQALTETDAEARARFGQWCEMAGLSVAGDRMGTMFATRAGTDPEALPVYVGSHLDTQPTGGEFDGVLGMLAGLELVRSLDDFGISTPRPIVITNWTNEEGTRFAPAMLASGVFAGAYDLAWAHAVTDAEGRSVGDELRRIGWLGEEEVGARQMHAYFELHIEQGPILDAEGKTIGVVTHGQGLRWLRVVLEGREAHTGSTPTPMRRNAGLGMSRVVDRADRIAREAGPDALAAVGRVELFPNSVNVIPGKAELIVDFRHRHMIVLDGLAARLRADAATIAEDAGLDLSVTEIGAVDPVSFDPGCIEAVRSAAERLGHSHMDIVGGAGHDACWVNRPAPAAMIMCPCVGGLSHNEAEDISEAWATAGADVLLHAVLELAEPVNWAGLR